MTVTIHSIFNSILWGGLMALGLSALSRSRLFLCRFGVTPLVVLTAAALARCCLHLIREAVYPRPAMMVY